MLEREIFLGGRACSSVDEVTGDSVDIGPHVVSSEHRNFLALLARLGTAHQLAWQPEPLITLLDAGRLLRMHSPAWTPPLHGLPNLPNALRCVTPRDLLSNWRVAWRAARLDEAATLALDGEDALGYLRRMGVSARFIEWFWASSMLALLNVPLAHCSAAAMMRVFRLMLGRSGYHFAFPKIGLSELYVPGCRRAVEAAGGSVQTAAGVREVILRDGRFHGFVLADGRQVTGRRGVLALAPQALQVLVNGCDGQARTLLAGLGQAAGFFEPCPYVSTMLWFDRPLTNERFWARVWQAGDLNMDFYDLSNIRPGSAGAPTLIASNAIYAHAAMGWSDDRIIAQTRCELEQFAPLAAQAKLHHARVHRIPMSVLCPLPGSEARRPGTATGLDGLWLAGDWTATAMPCSMESAARSGALAAEAICAVSGRPRKIAEPAPETTGLVRLLRRQASASASAG